MTIRGIASEILVGPGLKAIAKDIRTRETRDKCTTETAYYLLASALPAESFGRAVRGH